MVNAIDTHPHDRAAWHASDLRSTNNWVYELSETDIAELECALDAVLAQNLDIPDIGRDDFELPELSGKLQDILKEIENGHGFKLIRGVPVERLGKRKSGLIFWGIGQHLGRAVAQNAQGDVLGNVRDVGRDAKRDMHARGYQTTMHLPFHNDSCDIVGLLCLNSARSGGLSSIVNSVSIHDRMMSEEPDLAHALYGDFFVDRRGEEPKGEKPYYKVPIFNLHKGRLFNRYNRSYVETAQRFDDVPILEPNQIAGLDMFDALCASDEFRFDMDLQPGDMQFLNNYVVLHSRTNYVDWTEPERKRHLLRLWLFSEGLADQPDAFQDRYRDMKAWQANPRPPSFEFLDSTPMDTSDGVDR